MAFNTRETRIGISTDRNTPSRDYVNKMLRYSNLSLTKAVKLINEKYPDDKTTTQNLSNKLARGSIRDFEIAQLADVCGFNLILQSKTNADRVIAYNDITIDDMVSEGFESTDGINFSVIVFAGKLANRALEYYTDSINNNRDINALDEIALCHIIEKKFNVITKLKKN